MRYIIVIMSIFFFASCDDMIEEPNDAPGIKLIGSGFASDTLKYIENKSYQFQFSVTDGDGDEIDVYFKADSGKVSREGKTSEGVYSAFYTPRSKGDHKIKIFATDKIETSSIFLDGHFFHNFSPVAKINYKLVGQPSGFTYIFSAESSSDPDGHLTNATWTFKEKSTSDIIKIDPTAKQVSHQFSTYGIYTVILEVVDDNGATGKDSTIVDNSKPVPKPPVAKFFFPNGDTTFQAKNKTNMLLNAAQSSDGDGSGLTGFFWYLKRSGRTKNEFLGQTTGHSKTLFDLFFEPDIYIIGLKVQNGSGATSPIVWHKFEILNSSPVSTFKANIKTSFVQVWDTEKRKWVWISKYNITITENSSSDVDPGILSYRWMIEGEVLKNYRVSQAKIFTREFGLRTDTSVKQTTFALIVTDEQGIEARSSIIARNSIPK